MDRYRCAYLLGTYIFALILSQATFATVTLDPMPHDSEPLMADRFHLYRGSEHEKEIVISNPKEVPYFFQCWVEDQDGKQAPFIVTPSLTPFLNRDQQMTLRISKSDGNLPTNRETLFFLHVKGTPQSTDDQPAGQADMSYEVIRLVYQPPDSHFRNSVRPTREEASYLYLRWGVVPATDMNGQKLRIYNSSPYYYFMLSPVQLTHGTRIFDIERGILLGPGEVFRVPIQFMDPYLRLNVNYSAIREDRYPDDPLYLGAFYNIGAGWKIIDSAMSEADEFERVPYCKTCGYFCGRHP